MSAATGKRGDSHAVSRSEFWTGMFAAWVMIFIWSGFIVFSRLGVTTGFTPFDLGMLRFTTAGLILLPFAYAWWPRHLPFWKSMVLALVGPGVVYALLSYLGLSYAPSAYAGVFTNGTLPIFTALMIWLFIGDRFGPRALTGIALVSAGCAVLGLFDVGYVGPDSRFGALLLLSSGFVLSSYLVLARIWSLAPKQALVVIAIPNGLVMTPLWLLSENSGIATAPLSSIVLQAIFQGLGPSFVAVFCYAYAIDKLGSTTTAALSAVVPSTAAVLAIFVLGEWPSPVQWSGIGIVSLGLILFFSRRGVGRAG